MHHAFKGVYNYQNGAYNAQANVEANWYEVLVPTNSFQIIGKGKATKIIIPSELQNLGGVVPSIKELLTDPKDAE